MKQPARSYFLVLLAGLSFPVLAAETDNSLSDYFSAQNDLFERIDNFYRKKIRSGTKFNFDLHFEWAADRKKNAELQLYSLVCDPHYAPSGAKRLHLFREYAAWRKYVREGRPADASYIAPWNSLQGMMIDTQRFCTRYQALCLLLESPACYQIYSELAGKGEVRLSGKKNPVRLSYGEITTERRTPRNRSYYDFHAELIPATCSKHGAGYIGCLRTFEAPDSPPVRYYFCFWDGNGKPQALHPLDIPREKRNLRSAEINLWGHPLAFNASNGVYGETLEVSSSGDSAEISLIIKGKSVWTGKHFLSAINQNSIE